MIESDFPELLPKVQSVLLRYKRERRLSELARNLGFSKNRLSEILCGKRKLTLYYIVKFMEADVIPTEQLFAGIRIEKLPKDRRILARKLLLDPGVVEILDQEMQSLMKKAVEQKRIEDLRTILKTVLKK